MNGTISVYGSFHQPDASSCLPFSNNAVPIEVAATTTATMTFSKGGCVVEITQEEKSGTMKDFRTMFCKLYQW